MRATAAPAAYHPLADEPVFDPGVHLALGDPVAVRSLADLGYDDHRAASAAGPTAVTTPFRVLSDAGVEAVRAVCAALESGAIGGHDERAPRYVPGAGYRSRFLRDLVSSPELLAHVSRLAGVELVAHPVTDCQAYVNYAPADLAKAVDTWHVDSIAFDIVVMVSDPAVLVASSARAIDELGWRPRHTDLDEIVSDAWDFLVELGDRSHAARH